jgi:hypothetical protein
MNDRQRRDLSSMLDQVRTTRTVSFYWVYARYGADGESFLGVYRRRHEASAVTFDLRREAERSKLVEGQVWFLDDEFVFRTNAPTDPGLRYGFDRNTPAGGLRDVHPWLQQGRFRMIAAAGDAEDPVMWFEDAERGARVKAELAKLGVGAKGPQRGSGGQPAGLGDLSGLDDLDSLGALAGLDDL